jgi:ABC-type molybdate transport system substrate-binding protein
MKQSTIVTVVLGILLLISVVQAFQLTSIKSKLSDGGLTVSSSTAKTAPLGNSAGSAEKRTSAVPASIKDLPTMVGGC